MSMQAHIPMRSNGAAAPFLTPALLGTLQRKCACGGPSGTGQCANCNRPAAHFSISVPAIVHEVLRDPGHELNGDTRAFFEPRFGHDFSAVRVHTDARAAESAQSVHAHAYTVGNDIVFGASRYQPNAVDGQRLLAHELVHVVQQRGSMSNVQPNVQKHSIVADGHPSEHEAEMVGRVVVGGGNVPAISRFDEPAIQCHKDDLVAYSGGQSGNLIVLNAGVASYIGPAVSGHPGHGENEPSVGPIPTGRYAMHPRTTRSPVSTLEDGICGAKGISSGYQEITSTDPSPCEGAHYCNVACPTPDNVAQMCFTPQDCWGPKRIKIEGSALVTTPEGNRQRRDGFYLHGGNPRDAVSSGCVKTLNNGVFPEIRKLTGVKGAVPFCVGTACPKDVRDLGTTVETTRSFVEGLRSVVP